MWYRYTCKVTFYSPGHLWVGSGFEPDARIHIMSDTFWTNLKVAFRPETTPTKSIVLVTVACVTAGGELKRIHSTGAALRLAFYGMALVSLTTSATKYLGVHLSTF